MVSSRGGFEANGHVYDIMELRPGENSRKWWIWVHGMTNPKLVRNFRDLSLRIFQEWYSSWAELILGCPGYFRPL